MLSLFFLSFFTSVVIFPSFGVSLRNSASHENSFEMSYFDTLVTYQQVGISTTYKVNEKCFKLCFSRLLQWIITLVQVRHNFLFVAAFNFSSMEKFLDGKWSKLLNSAALFINSIFICQLVQNFLCMLLLWTIWKK